jgi:carbon storage regulator
MMRRRAGEAILIGDDIEVHIAHIGRTRVKIAIRAPRRVRVVAREIHLVGEQNRAAAAAPAPMVAGLLARTLENCRQGSRNLADMESEVDPGQPPRRGARARQDAG